MLLQAICYEALQLALSGSLYVSKLRFYDGINDGDDDDDDDDDDKCLRVYKQEEIYRDIIGVDVVVLSRCVSSHGQLYTRFIICLHHIQRTQTVAVCFPQSAR